jgi:hypothetical protein
LARQPQLVSLSCLLFLANRRLLPLLLPERGGRSWSELDEVRTRLLQSRAEWLRDRADFQAAFDRLGVLSALDAGFDRFAALLREVTKMASFFN